MFFIDEVANYREYDDAGQAVNGKYARMFEEEYADIVKTLQIGLGDHDGYLEYLNSIKPAKAHAGYFAIDKKGKMINSKLKHHRMT